MRQFSPLQVKTASSIWQSGVKSASSLVGLLIRAVPLMLGATSPGWVKATFVFARWAVRMKEHQGQRGLAMHLKAANVTLLRYVSGEPLANPRLAGVAVACNHSGLPRLIVGNHRLRIKQGDVGCIRFWLGLFTLYRVLDFKGRVSFTSIVGEGREIPLHLLKLWAEFTTQFRDKLVEKGAARFRTDFVPPQRADKSETRFTKYVKAVRYYPYGATEKVAGVGQKRYTEQLWGYVVRMIPLLKSGANSKDGSVSALNVVDDIVSWLTRPQYLIHFMTLVQLTRAWNLVDHPAWALGVKRVEKSQTQLEDSRIARAVASKSALDASALELEPQGELGRLHLVEEPGKMRVVAMVDCLTQWFLYPLHRHIFDKILRVIPQDGTFDQMAPIGKLLKYMERENLYECFSFDLSAATDRIPVGLQQSLLACFTTQEFAHHWRHLLSSRYFKIPKWTIEFLPSWYNVPGRERGLIRYAVGQPMGAYSSWAMLALVHHAIVQFAAKRANVEGWFEAYAVLGDDVVIAHRGVALEYTRLMEDFGVNIGFHKSIISKNRSLEFAKRFFYKGVEVTPLPLVAIAVSWISINGVPEVLTSLKARVGKFPSLYQIGRSLGFGFKASSRAATSLVVTLPRRLRDAVLVLSRPGTLPWSRKDLWEWFRMRSTVATSDLGLSDIESVTSFVYHLMASRPSAAIRKALYKALVPFTLPSAWAEEEVGLHEWWANCVKAPYREPMLAVITEYEAKVFQIQQRIVKTEEDISALLDAFEAIEKLACKLPVKVELTRNVKDVVLGSSERFPKTVRRWRQVHRRFGRAPTPEVLPRVRPMVHRGEIPENWGDDANRPW